MDESGRWIIPHEAAESFGWTFLDDFDAFRSEPLQAASERERMFLKSPVYCGGTLEGEKKKKNLQFKTFEGELLSDKTEFCSEISL